MRQVDGSIVLVLALLYTERGLACCVAHTCNYYSGGRGLRSGGGVTAGNAESRHRHRPSVLGFDVHF